MCLSIISKLTRWYQARNDDYVAPVVPGMRRTSGSKRSRILDDNEIRAVWAACNQLEGNFGHIIKLLLTGSRRSKLAQMKWSDIDLQAGDWVIPADAREKGTAGTLRLPPMALGIVRAIADQPRPAGNDFVFATDRGRREGRGYFNSWSQKKAELDAKLSGEFEPWVVHDLRRTARSLLARANVRPEVAERLLGHKQQGITAVYDHHDYADQKADALNRLAALVDTIINPPEANVVSLRPSREA